MKDVSIPIPNFNENEPVEVEVKIGKNKVIYNFRIVKFPWENDINDINNNEELINSLFKINRLKKMINEYDKNWELIQIYTPPMDAKKIEILYRKK